ncbi:cupin domain-containing protein [Actinoplanes sp. NPDC049118]|uniref:cupin domain-containing protein n=1 Tax=Actinoplanes sp. NPDC049118 TaxID=3155769 RepID=UPI0033FE293F
MAELLDLAPHPEGGWYRQSWASDITFDPPGYPGERSSATAIYFLLAAGETSRWHRVRSAELWLWHAGAPLTLSLAGGDDSPAADAETIVLGPDVAAGQRPQALVPPNMWQSAVPTSDDDVLVSCIVSPGFDFADFTMASSPETSTANHTPCNS